VAVSVDAAMTASFSTWEAFLACRSGLRGRSQ
jgi:hypothetical protein